MWKVKLLDFQSCPALCDPMDCSLPGSSVHGNYPGKNTDVGYHSLLQGIFPTQRLNLSLLHCRQILYRLSHQGSLSSRLQHSNEELVDSCIHFPIWSWPPQLLSSPILVLCSDSDTWYQQLDIFGSFLSFHQHLHSHLLPGYKQTTQPVPHSTWNTSTAHVAPE